VAQQQYELVNGMDWTLPVAPPLLEPPLSLISESRSLINIEGLAARQQAAVEKLASAQEQLEAYDHDGIIGDDDQPGEADSIEDARKALEQQMSEWQGEIGSLDSQIKELQRFEHGFIYLPELGLSAVTIFTEDEFPAISNPLLTALKQVGPNQNLFGWSDPFLAVGLDSRSTFGWPNEDHDSRAQRAVRGLRAHEGWQVEHEFWTGQKVPTNVHLTASPNSPQSSPHRTLRFPFPNPTPTPGTILGVPESLSDSLASLDQAIANADGGVGMIHATPYIVQKFSQVYPFLRDSAGNIRTVNNNYLVPGYGYTGTGPDQASREVTDGVTTEGSVELTSATADFTLFDIGSPVSGTGIPPGTVIAEWVSASEVNMSQQATADGTGVTVTFSGQGGNNTGSVLQWSYATDMQFHCQGDINVVARDLREQSPDLTVDNLVEVRAERSHCLISNNLLRAAVLVDSGTL
jgi:HAMP domain-containing protein